LRLLPILLSQPEELPPDDPSERPFVYLSPKPIEELHPYGNPPGIGPATDALLSLMKPYYKDDTLVVGRLYSSSDVPELFAVTKPYFTEIAKWIKNEWSKLPTGQYLGTEAAALKNKGAKLAYFPPDVPIQVK
jgi:hypothetical protein